MATRPKDGGSAFPSPGVMHPYSGDQQGAYEGMSLRDYFAAQALPSAMLGYRLENETDDQMITRKAGTAYRIADAMLAARKR